MSQNELRFTHYGEDYKPDIKGLPDAGLKALHITSDDYLAPFNPAIYSKYYGPEIEKLSDAELKARYIGPKAEHPVRIAFFGLKADSHDNFEGARQTRNFIESYQKYYNSKLFTVLQLWRDGLPKTYFTDDSTIYFSNFVKIVLREDFFKESKESEEVKKALTPSNCDETLALFKQLAKQEVTELNNNGCCLFVCFGDVVYDFMRDIIKESHLYSDSKNIGWIRERGYSRYIEKNTIECIEAASKWLKNTKQA